MVLLAVVLLVAIAGRLVRKLCHFAGFGIADIVLGIAVSVLKYMLLLSVLFSAFDTLNEDCLLYTSLCIVSLSRMVLVS